MLSFKTIRIDNISQVSDEDISHENLEYMHGTGIAISTGKNRMGEKKYHYRHGVQTALGDIEDSVWIALVKKLIEKENGQQLYEHLLEWEKAENTVINREAEDMIMSALRDYVSQMNDNKVWWDYIRFNAKYYPEKLADPTLITVIPECCKEPCKVPPEQIRRWNGEETIPCPICNKGSLFEIVDEKGEN